eukprot:1851715-Rhodomonas_salina.4
MEKNTDSGLHCCGLPVVALGMGLKYGITDSPGHSSTGIGHNSTDMGQSGTEKQVLRCRCVVPGAWVDVTHCQLRDNGADGLSLIQMAEVLY